MLDGDMLTLFDNVGCVVQSPALDAVLTSVVYRDRVLGTSQSMSATVTTTVALTGNGLTYGGDTARRVLPIELESPLERPEERGDLRHENLIEWVTEHRARLVVAALTCVRGWYTAGAPDMGVKPLGSYEGWSRVVPAIVRWLDLACPLEARRGLAELDATRATHEALVAGWARLQGEGPGLTAAVTIRTLYPPPTREERPPEPGYFPELRDAIESVTESSRPTARALGNALRPFRRRVVGGRMLDARTVHGSTSWRVVRARGAAPSTPPVGVDVVDVEPAAAADEGAA
ncbi:MAG: hypothetical protein IPJ34_22570 [Myxococcales bacterium]|nr:hypothetical protein [Myxococcales bacterium]